MNKRQKKKQEKKEAWNVHYKEYIEQIKKEEAELMKNGEGYKDPTMGVALRNLIRKGY